MLLTKTSSLRDRTTQNMNTPLTEIELSWDGTKSKFVCEDKKIENHIFFKIKLALFQHKTVVTEFLQGCDFQLIGYEHDGGFKIKKSEEVFFDIADEGTGFNIVFNLAAIALLDLKTSYTRNKKTGKFDKRSYLFDDHKNINRIYVNYESIKSNLHPLLFECVKSLQARVLLRCRFLSPEDVRQYLKCFVNPLGDCRTCHHFESDGNEIIQFR